MENINDIEFIVLGDDVFPELPYVSNYKRSLPDATSLYHAKLDAMHKVTKKYFCFLDGGGDKLPADFAVRCNDMALGIERENAYISYGDETIYGRLIKGKHFDVRTIKKNPYLIHHAPICRTDAAQSMDWPEGCYWFERVCYSRLAALGHYYHPGVHYDWIPSPNGARLWKSTTVGIENSNKFIRDTFAELIGSDNVFS